MHTLRRIQRFPIKRKEAWEFFSSPRNLQEITPTYMGFYINSHLPRKMYPGMIISYTVMPLFNIPVNWVTEISQINEPEFFIDTQLAGPYKVWHHQHHFREIKGGTEMEDIVNYALPLGFGGKVVHRIFIRKKLEEIFNYRFRVLKERFGEL